MVILWIKRGAAVSNGILWVAFFYNEAGLAMVGMILSLLWIADDMFRPNLREFIRPSMLAVHTALSAYGVLKGAPPVLAVFIVSSSLLSWNAGLFLSRWKDVPLTAQSQYLKHLGVVMAVGIGLGFSAVTLRGVFSLSFFWTWLLIVYGSFLWLRIVAKAARKESLLMGSGSSGVSEQGSGPSACFGTPTERGS